MSVKPVQFVVALALMIPITGGGRVWAQEKAQNQGRRTRVVAQGAQRAGKGRVEIGQASQGRRNRKPALRGEKAKEDSGPSSTAAKTGNRHRQGRQAVRAQIVRRRARYRPRIKRSTNCSENWARPRTSRPPKIAPETVLPAESHQPPPRGEKAGADKLGEKDKDLDERLEELTGRKKKRPSSDQERSGPVGEMIKEMRDVEERLGKPDPSEDTQKKQKQIVKRIETMIEQAKQSGSSGGQHGHQARSPAGTAAGSAAGRSNRCPGAWRSSHEAGQADHAALHRQRQGRLGTPAG